MSRTLRIDDDGVLRTLDQTMLPFAQRELALQTADDCHRAIVTMQVRGAPLIGAVGAWGLALALRDDPSDANLLASWRRLLAARPTAVNLRWALDEMRAAWERELDAGGERARPASVAAALLARAQAIHDDDIARCLAIGEHGAGLFAAGARILTHCNAGALATAGYGTALGVVRSAHARHGGVSVWVDETRPWLQGARLTAWELEVEGIPYRVISDSMAGFFFSRGEVDGVVVGADRIAADGDTANKIGTYTVSVLAKEHHVPFYVAAPLSTVDLTVASGAAIPIEERAESEVTSFAGRRVAPAGARARHPAFDVTPAANITAIVTEAGVLRPPFGPALAAACAAGACRPGG
jgi:methylthioribose-1-phosphate isomerase